MKARSANQRSRHARRLFAAGQHTSGIGQPQLNKPGMGKMKFTFKTTGQGKPVSIRFAGQIGQADRFPHMGMQIIPCDGPHRAADVMAGAYATGCDG